MYLSQLHNRVRSQADFTPRIHVVWCPLLFVCEPWALLLLLLLRATTRSHAAAVFCILSELSWRFLRTFLVLPTLWVFTIGSVIGEMACVAQRCSRCRVFTGVRRHQENKRATRCTGFPGCIASPRKAMTDAESCSLQTRLNAQCALNWCVHSHWEYPGGRRHFLLSQKRPCGTARQAARPPGSCHTLYFYYLFANFGNLTRIPVCGRA